jgi:hypothetical protein
MWISGPITTVHDEHICHELTAVARINLATRRWLSETSRSAAVVLGNHLISVGHGRIWWQARKAVIINDNPYDNVES